MDQPAEVVPLCSICPYPEPPESIHRAWDSGGCDCRVPCVRDAPQCSNQPAPFVSHRGATTENLNLVAEMPSVQQREPASGDLNTRLSRIETQLAVVCSLLEDIYTATLVDEDVP